MSEIKRPVSIRKIENRRQTFAVQRPESALGHKETCAPQIVMSAFPPKADMCDALVDVCFGPIADKLVA